MTNSKYRLVMVRHGHTEWNLTNRFTGWSDIPLSETGKIESRQAGKRLSEEGYTFDEAHISVLMRTREALDSLLSAANHPDIPVYCAWELNERHYGSLQGLNKEEIFDTWGKEKAYRWWRGFDDAPPPLAEDDKRHPRHDPLYKDVDPACLPQSESLAQCLSRTLPYWHKVIAPNILTGRQLIIVSHGNTLRGLRMHIENIGKIDIQKIEIPLGVPFVYHLDENLKPTGFEMLEY